MRRLLAGVFGWLTDRDAFRCSTCGGLSYDPDTVTCLPCEDQARAMRRAERADPGPGYHERLITKVGAAWHVADRWRDLPEK
jgi:hypothetical protein